MHRRPIFLASPLLAATLLFADHTAAISPTAKFVAVRDDAGDVWLMRTNARKLLFHAGSDHVSFAWSPSEESLLVASQGRIRNYQVPSAKLRFDAAGSSAEFSPNGRSLSVIRNHNLSITPSKFSTQKLWSGEADSVFAHEFDPGNHYWWSPDSNSLAYLETDFQHADAYPLPGAPLPTFRLKIVSPATGAIRTVAESSDAWPYILRVTFLPDSRRLAFYRLNRLQNKAELCLWENGAIHTVLTESDDYWVNAPATPLFFGRRFAVTSERSGHRRAYVYDLDGTLIRDLTPPDLEVAELLSANTESAIFVTGSTGDHQEQHLFRINTETGESTQITSEPGWHEITLNASANAYVDSYSTALKPPALSWQSIDGTQHGQITEATAAEQPVANEYLPIKTHDGVLLPARLFKPADFNPNKKYPIILYTFSGPRGRVVSDSWGGWQMAWNRSMVPRGFLVLAVDVRGSGGYSHLFEEYIHYRFGAQETVDLREVVSFLRIQTYVDPQRIGIWGCDYGAHTVIHAMFEFPHGFRAGFADSPITDWHQYNAYFTERYLGLPSQHIPEYNDSSALENAKHLTGRLLVATNPQNPIILNTHLEALKKAAPGVETLSTGPDRALMLKAMTDFFEHHL